MKPVRGMFYSLMALAYMAAFSSYYWIARYLFEVENPQKGEFITGFMMIASLSSPIYFGVALMALFRYRNVGTIEIAAALAPALLILVGLGILVLFRS